MERGVVSPVATPQYPMTELAPVKAAQHITRIGALARAQLVPGQQGQVLAVVSDAIYLLTPSDEILWLAGDGAPMHRRCLTVSASLPRAVEGAPLHVADGCLRIDPGVAFDCATASLWQPPQINRDELVEISEVTARVRALVSGLDVSQAKGFGRLIPDIVGCEPDSAAATDDLVLVRARHTILSLVDACLKRDGPRIARCADELVGLGAGLTPSGDDFVGGLLFAAHALLHAYPGSAEFDLGITVEPYRMRTNQISFALLNDLANGHAIEPMHITVNGILTGESLRRTQLSIAHLTRVGHSTGWDMLAGLFTALLMTHERGRLPAQVAQSGQT